MKVWILALLCGTVLAAPGHLRSKRNVGNLLDQLVQETGLHELLPWLQNLIANDPDAQRVIEYIKSGKVEDIKDHLRSCSGYQGVKDKLQAEGIDVVKILDDIKNFLYGGSPSNFQVRRPLGQIVNELIGKLDLDRIMAIIQEKKDDPNMKKLIAFLDGPELKAIDECMKESSDVQELVEILKSEGIDVYKLRKMIRSLFGSSDYYHYNEARNVKNLIDELVKETGMIDLLPYLQDLIAKDADAQRVIDYINSGKVEPILDHLRNCPEYQGVKDRLAAEGLDVVKILDDIKNFILESKPSNFQARRPLGDLINDFIKKLDLERIMAIVQEKKDDPNMKKLIAFLDGPELKAVDDCMNESPHVQELLAVLKTEGIEVKKLLKMIRSLFGSTNYFYNEERNLGNFFEQLIHETGIAELLPWLQDKIRNDPDVQRIVEYFRGEDWKAIKNQLTTCPGYQNVKDKLLGEGIDVVQILDDIKSFVTGGTRAFLSRKTLGDLLNEFLSKLDLNKIIGVIQDKLENHPDMKKVIEFLKGDELKAVVECMKGSPEVQELIAQLKKEGIDLRRMIALLTVVFDVDIYTLNY